MSGDLQLRVRVLDAWDDIVLNVPAATSISALKQQALSGAHVTDDQAAFLVKFRGAELSDESRSLAEIAVPSDAALIVMRRRRVPVR